MNYTELQDTIAKWFARDDLPTDVFIDLAEQELNRVLRLHDMQAMVEATPDAQTNEGDWYIVYPEGFLAMKSVKSNGVQKDYLSPACELSFRSNAYQLMNGMILLPTNDPVELVYYKREPSLSDANQTNAFTENASDALLYIALAHAGSYMAQPGDYRLVADKHLADIRLRQEQADFSGAPLVQRGI